MTRKIRVNMLSESEFTVKGHGVHTAYVELTAALKKRPDVTVWVNKDDVVADITHIQTVGTYSLKRLLFSPGKKVVSAHLVPDSFIGSLVLAKYWHPFAYWYLKFFYSRADLVLAVSSMVQQELVENMGLKNRVEVLYNTIDMDYYKTTARDKVAARKRLHIKEDDFVVVGNGQIQPRKRFDVFVQLAKQLPDVQFLWVGGIPFKAFGAEYKAMLKLIGNAPPNLRVTGVIPLKKVRAYLQASDLFLLPAEQENHPMSVLEAAGVGLPIILRNIPQYDDTFRDLALLETDETFLPTIIRLRDDIELRKTCAAKSRRIAKRFSSTTGAERATEFYRSLL